MRLNERRLRKIIRGLVLEVFVSSLPQPPPAFNKLPGYAKNKQMNIFDDLYDLKNSALRDEIFKPIDDSYRKGLGQQNADIQEPDHLMKPDRNDYSEFLAWDIDADPHPDVIRGMKPKAGYMKLSLSATDLSRAAGDYSKADTIARLKDGQHFAEMSGPAAGVAMGAGVKAILDPEKVQQLLGPNKKIQWFGVHPYDQGHPDFQDKNSRLEAEGARKKSSAGYKPDDKTVRSPGMYNGWYVRMLGKPPVPHAKMIFGEIN